MTHERILVAGVGNIFEGDDGFGVEVVRRLGGRSLGEDVKVVDFGIRGFDLAYALADGYETAILVDAVPRGEKPGTLFVIKPEVDAGSPPAIDPHRMDPVKVLQYAATLEGKLPKSILVLGCQPSTPAGAEEQEGDDLQVGLSPAVEASVDGAVELLETLVAGARK